MKGKLGIILLLLCIGSYFIYNARDPRKNKANIEKIITGRISDSKSNIPIKDVSISIQGTNPKSHSNSNGEFAILATETQELVFRHNDYKTKVIIATDAKDITMERLTDQTDLPQ